MFYSFEECIKPFIMNFLLLRGSALAQAMQLRVTLSKRSTETISAHQGGDFKPIGFYATLGYTKEQLENIVKNCSKEWDDEALCWNYAKTVHGWSKRNDDISEQ